MLDYFQFIIIFAFTYYNTLSLNIELYIFILYNISAKYIRSHSIFCTKYLSYELICSSILLIAQTTLNPINK